MPLPLLVRRPRQRMLAYRMLIRMHSVDIRIYAPPDLIPYVAHSLKLTHLSLQYASFFIQLIENSQPNFLVGFSKTHNKIHQLLPETILRRDTVTFLRLQISCKLCVEILQPSVKQFPNLIHVFVCHILMVTHCPRLCLYCPPQASAIPSPRKESLSSHHLSLSPQCNPFPASVHRYRRSRPDLSSGAPPRR